MKNSVCLTVIALCFILMLLLPGLSYAQAVFRPSLVTVTASFSSPTVPTGGSDLLTIQATNNNPAAAPPTEKTITTTVVASYQDGLGTQATVSSNPTTVTEQIPGTDTTAHSMSCTILLPLWLAEIHLTGANGESRSSTDPSHYLLTLNLPDLGGGQAETVSVLFKAK